MSDQDNLTIDINIGTRATMNTSTPRVGPWTYHHVLPVRLYFMAAWTMLRICKHSSAWKKTTDSAREALTMMTQYKANADSIRLFLDTKDDNPPAVDIADQAKLCASPPAGGFGGPNPNQRTDDPHDLPERYAPVSADVAWFSALAGIGYTLKEAFNLQQLPAPNTVVSATHTVAGWCGYVAAFDKSIRVADGLGAARFDGSDWLLDDGRPWTLLAGQTVPANPNKSLRLRRKTEQPNYHDRNSPLPVPANAWKLQRQADFIKIPAPPLP